MQFSRWTVTVAIGSLSIITDVGAGGPVEATSFSVAMHDAGFERIAIEHGVFVYKDKNASVIRIAADGRFEAPPAAVMRALLDYEAQVGIVARLVEARIMERGPSRIVVYERVDLPFISQRDWVLEVKVGRERDIHWLRFRALSEQAAPLRKDVVRVTQNHGSWQLKPLDGGRATLARFQVRVDLAGWVPRWMAKASAGKELPEMFLQVCRMLRQSSNC